MSTDIIENGVNVSEARTKTEDEILNMGQEPKNDDNYQTNSRDITRVHLSGPIWNLKKKYKSVRADTLQPILFTLTSIKPTPEQTIAALFEIPSLLA